MPKFPLSGATERLRLPATSDVTSWSSVTLVPGTSRIDPEMELRKAYTAARFIEIERDICRLPPSDSACLLIPGNCTLNSVVGLGIGFSLNPS